MADLSLTVPDALVSAAGSVDAARQLLLTAGVSELVRRGTITTEVAEAWLGESIEDWMRLADSGGAFDFWNDPGEDIYTLEDGEPL